MIEFGKSLKAAREAKGFTIAQMAELTHLAPTTVNELESEDFSHIAAPIYGRGFVKLYCEAAGIDPKPFVAEFMEIFTGNHDTGIRERPSSVPPEETPAPASRPTSVPPEEEPAIDSSAMDSSAMETADFSPESAADPEPDVCEAPPIRNPLVARQHDLFGYEIPAVRPNAAPVAEAENVLQSAATPRPAPTASNPPVSPSSDNSHSFARYAAPLRQLKPIVHSSAWRIGILALAALALLVTIVLGIRMVYRATTASPLHEPAAAVKDRPTVAPTIEPTASARKAPKAVPAAPQKPPATTARTPQRIPALYVD